MKKKSSYVSLAKEILTGSALAIAVITGSAHAVVTDTNAQTASSLINFAQSNRIIIRFKPQASEAQCLPHRCKISCEWPVISPWTTYADLPPVISYLS